MKGHVFLTPGDLTQLSADAIAYSASNTLSTNGNLYSSFDANVTGFRDWYAQRRSEFPEKLPIGTSFWMPLGERKPRGVVVVVSTGADQISDKAGVAVRAAITAAVTQLRKDERTGRLLIALPTFRVGMGGDHRQRLLSARSQIQAARATLEELVGVDVVFVAYTGSLYRIFLEARRSIFGPNEVPNLPELERALRENSCVLFVGAGLSVGAGLPGWNELIARLSHDLQIQSSPNVDNLDLAQWYREQFGNDRLADVLRATFRGAGLPTLAHYLLMSLPVRHVITTNYDHLLERSLQAIKRHPMSVVRQEDVVRTGSAGVFVVKLHGDADHPGDIVLSTEDYQSFFENRPAMALLLEGLLLNQTFFFVGYSLRDLNFREVFGRIARMLRESRRPAFATSFEALGETGPYVQRQWERQQLHLIPIPGDSSELQVVSLNRFLDALAERVTLHAPPPVLASDVPCLAGLERLRAMLEASGNEVQRLCSEADDEERVQFLAEVLEFLAARGWQPSGWKPLCQIYESLAERTVNPELRRRLLVAALSVAETFADATRLRALLEP